MMQDVYQLLKEKGITLPQPSRKAGIYTRVQPFGERLLYCSGCGPNRLDGTKVIGKLGRDLTVEQGQEASYWCMLNLLGNLHDAIGDLNRIKKFVKVLAFVNCTDDFTMQPTVVNGGSSLLVELFGQDALAARTAVGTNALPNGIACEIEMLVELKDEPR